MKELLVNGRASELSLFSDDDLARAVIISLFSWSRAHDDDEVEGRRMGFWGDTYGETGEVTGSRLWLLRRQKILPTTVERCRQYAQEALAWMVDDGVAESVSVKAERGALDRVDLVVDVVRGSDVRRLRFADVWSLMDGI